MTGFCTSTVSEVFPKSLLTRRPFVRILLAAFTWLSAGCALASNIGISPTSIELHPAHKVQTLTLTNPGKATLAFEVTVKRWQMAPDGKWRLDEISGASELVVHPLNFQLAPGKSQYVRVGLARPVTGTERAYRVFVRELPRASTTENTSAMVVLTQFSLPLFVSDGHGKPEPTIQSWQMGNRRWQFVLHAGNTGHLTPGKASLHLSSAAGKLLSTQQVKLGYVLAGAGLPIEGELDSPTCKNATTYELVADLPVGTIKGALPAGSRKCDP